MNFRSRLLGISTLAVFTGVLALGAIACGDDDEDNGKETTATEVIVDGSGDGNEADVRAALEAAVAAWNGGDVETFLASFTDAGLLSSFDATREEAELFIPDFIGDPPITLGDLTISVADGTATAEAPSFAFGILFEPTRFSLILEGAAWLFDGEEDLPAVVPDGVTGVDLVLAEFSFNFSPDDITDGNFAFNVSNIGGEQHELALVRVPEGFDLASILESPELPPEVELLAVAGPWDAQTESVAAFTEPLSAGRYGMLCFVETADGTPHAALGMINEFTLE